MTEWFRSWHGAPTDPKWLGIAKRADVAPGIAVAVAWALMDRASQAADRGSIEGYDADGLACFFGCEPENVEAIVSAMTDKGMISDGRFTSWERRQPKREDDSAKRVREHRERKREQRNAPVTQRNAPDTDTDTDTDTELVGSDEPTCPEPEKSAPVAIGLPTVSDGDFPVFETDIAEWATAFPAVNIRQQLAAMRQWLIANPKKRKTAKGMKRFVVSWLDRRQNAGGSPHSQTSPPSDRERMNAALDRIISGEPDEPTHHSTIETSFERTDRRGTESVVQFPAIPARN